MENVPQEGAITPNVSILVSTILQENPFHTQTLNKTLACLKLDEIQYLEEYLVFCLSKGLSIEYLARCYATIMADVLRESIYFQEHKKYRYSNFSEVASSVYYNDTYMSLYMNGLLITLFFWLNHLKLYRFFRNTLPTDKEGSYLEIGPGHGYFLMTAMERTLYNNFAGIDLSETSIRQTQALLNIKRHGKNLQLHCADFLKFPLKPSSFDAIVMGEMLEHVENPQDFLKKIVLIAKNDTYIFITTCINAPAIDHIYQFKHLKQLEDIFSQCGLAIKEQCILPYVGKTLEECAEHFLTINVGYVLEKK